MASAAQAGTGHLSIDLRWRGPYGWLHVGRADSLPRLDQAADGKRGGVYLEASEYDGGGYILLSAGITKRPFPKRFAEHRRKFLSGDYNILDVKSLRAGVRKEIWHGWIEARRPERRLEYGRRKAELQAAALEQILDRRIFVADVEGRRLQARIEAAVMFALYAGSPFQDIPDRGGTLSRATRLKRQFWLETIAIISCTLSPALLRFDRELSSPGDSLKFVAR